MSLSLRLGMLIAFVLPLPMTGFTQFVITSNTTPSYTITVAVNAASLVNRVCHTGSFEYQPLLDYRVVFSSATAPALNYFNGNMYCGASGSEFALPLGGGTGSLLAGPATYTGNITCATATPAAIGCNSYTLSYGGPGVPASFAFIISNASPLPIAILRFDARKDPGGVFLVWETANAENGNSLRLESSRDARTWEPSDAAAGQRSGGSRIIYEAREPLPAAGYRYYRLRHNDPDGSVSFSNTLAVRADNDPAQVAIRPNPVTGRQLRIEGLEHAEAWDLSVLNMAGQQLDYQRSGVAISLPELAPGLYILQLRNRQTGESKAFRFQKSQ